MPPSGPVVPGTLDLLILRSLSLGELHGLGVELADIVLGRIGLTPPRALLPAHRQRAKAARGGDDRMAAGRDGARPRAEGVVVNQHGGTEEG